MLRERERERERDFDWRETLIGCLLYTSPPGVEPTAFWGMGRCSNKLSHLARSHYLFLNSIFWLHF